MIDFKHLAGDLITRASILVPTWLPDGKRSGSEWVAKNPRRNDHNLGSFKINLNTGIWQDFACGDNGSDLISLYAYIHNIGQAEAARELSGDDSIKKIKPKIITKKSKWVATGEPGPHEATDDDMAWPKLGNVTAWWAVRNEQNQVLYYDVRFERTKPDGQIVKSVLPLSWCRNIETGDARWGYKSYPAPRPLYGYVAVKQSQISAPVIIVEGMKCAAALATMIGDKYPVVTWQGGCNAIDKSDWTPLSGRRVVIWPDNDKPGINAAITLIDCIMQIGCAVAVIQPHDDAPSGWDCADLIDSGADRATVMGYIRCNKISVDDFLNSHCPKNDIPLPDCPPGFDDCPPAYCDEPIIPIGDELNIQPFRVLGHDRDLYYYLPRAKGQLVALKMSGHTKNNLLSLAPLSWWEDNYPSKRGVSWTAAQDHLMRKSDRIGPFSALRVRGRGAWRDGNDLIVHVGNHLVVNGTNVDPVDYQGVYIYERGISLKNDCNKIASASLGREIIDLCRLFPWRSDVHGVLAAGWAFLAPICGALYWRPHIWITGEPGSGKSWFRDNVIVPFVRDFGIISQGSTSAAGVRQALGSDALPVLFDEAESNEKKSAERIAEVLELMRQSSMSGESAIIKGTSSGESISYAPSSMWCLSSVVTAIKHQADQGRISILELCKYNDAMAAHKKRSLREQHRITADKSARLFTANNCNALRARAFKRLPEIIETIDVFRNQAADHFGNQRAGDQIGTLLAGAYCLASDGRANPQKAADYIQRQDWTEIIRSDENEHDHDQLLRHILQHVVRVPTPSDGVVDRTIAQLIRVGFQDFSATSLNKQIARDALSVFGIYLGDHPTRCDLYISPKHRGIERILHGTPWGINYARILLRIPGVSQSQPRPVTDLSGNKTSKRLIVMDAKPLMEAEFDDTTITQMSKNNDDFGLWENDGIF